jgi:hypothetical protein
MIFLWQKIIKKKLSYFGKNYCLWKLFSLMDWLKQKILKNISLKVELLNFD